MVAQMNAFVPFFLDSTYKQYYMMLIFLCLIYSGASLVAQIVKNLPVMQENQAQPLGWEDSPGEGIGNPLQYSCLENSMNREFHG